LEEVGKADSMSDRGQKPGLVALELCMVGLVGIREAYISGGVFVTTSKWDDLGLLFVVGCCVVRGCHAVIGRCSRVCCLEGTFAPLGLE